MITLESFVRRLLGKTLGILKKHRFPGKTLENPKKPLFLPPFLGPPKNPQKHPKIRADFSSTIQAYTIRTKNRRGQIPEHANLYRY